MCKVRKKINAEKFSFFYKLVYTKKKQNAFLDFYSVRAHNITQNSQHKS